MCARIVDMLRARSFVCMNTERLIACGKHILIVNFNPYSQCCRASVLLSAGIKDSAGMSETSLAFRLSSTTRVLNYSNFLIQVTKFTKIIKMEFVSKTQHYLKVKKPLLERQRRARMNKHLDALKTLIAEFQGDDAILRMDKADMLETAITFMRSHAKKSVSRMETGPSPTESFRFGYMNAVNEVSRVMAATQGMNVEMGKVVMTRLGCEFNRMLQSQSTSQPLIEKTAPMSPASSGYHSDCGDSSPMASPTNKQPWRPW